MAQWPEESQMSPDRVSDGKLYIDGSFTGAAEGRTAPVLEKATGEEMGTYADAGKADVDRAVAAAVAAGDAWAAALPDERAWLLRRAGDLVQAVLPPDRPRRGDAADAGVHRGDLRTGHPDHRGRLGGGGARTHQRRAGTGERGLYRRREP